MSLRDQVSKISRGWEAAHRLARAVLRLESFLSTESTETLKRSGGERNPLLAVRSLLG